MKNINLKLYYFLISFVFSFEVNSEDLFGYKIYSDAKEYFSKNFIDNNKSKHSESKTGFYIINVTNEISEINKSPYFEDYLFHIDNDDKIHGILGKQRYRNLEICKSVAEDLKKIVESKYDIQLDSRSKKLPEVEGHILDGITDNEMRVSINCNYYYDDSFTQMWFFIISYDLRLAIYEYYNSM